MVVGGVEMAASAIWEAVDGSHESWNGNFSSRKKFCKVAASNEETPKGPSARSKHSATLLGGKLYLLGGRNGNLPLKDLWKYDLGQGAWEQLRPAGESPPCLQDHTAVAYNGCLYVFGGEVGFSAAGETPLWVYNIKDNRWRKIRGPGGAARPKGRRGHTALVYRDSMLLYGGYQDLRGSSSELWLFHFETESWHLVSGPGVGSNPSPPPRHKHSAVFHDQAMWVYGGMTDLHERADFWKWDAVSRSWSPLRAKPGPGPLHSHAACRLPSSMLLFGGERDGQPTNDLWRFHFGTETWERVQVPGVRPEPIVECVALAVSELQLNPPPPPPTPTLQLQQQQRMRLAGPPGHNRVSPVVAEASTPGSGGGSFLREISKLSQINLSRLTHHNCSYSVLSSRDDSTESLLPALSRSSDEELSSSCSKLVKSQSVNFQTPIVPTSIATSSVSSSAHHSGCNNRTRRRIEPSITTISSTCSSNITTGSSSKMKRDPISVPNFGAISSLPTPALTPVEVTRLVFLDSSEDEENQNQSDFRRLHQQFDPHRVIEVDSSQMPKSQSTVRFRDASPLREEATSDYASLETVSRLNSNSSYSVSSRPTPSPDDEWSSSIGSGVTGCTGSIRRSKKLPAQYGFSNPHYLGPDVNTLLLSSEQHRGFARLLNSSQTQSFSSSTKMGKGALELANLDRNVPRSLALDDSPLDKQHQHQTRKPKILRASSASRADCSSTSNNNFTSQIGTSCQQYSTSTSSGDPRPPLYMFLIGGKPLGGQITNFKRPVSLWRLHLAPDIY